MEWQDLINEESKKEYFKNLSQFIEQERKLYKIYPNDIDVFNAFKYSSISNTKVVIVGMDPYHGAGQAHGLSFSVPDGVALPPSLRNIFKEIKSDLNLTYDFTSGCLESWATQGVLLLNTVLTVREGQAASHQKKGWEVFTDKVITILNQQDRPIVFILWGAFAKSKKILLNNQKHFILESAHPSPLSCHNGFFGCKHFSKTNQFLINNQLTPINWINK